MISSRQVQAAATRTGQVTASTASSCCRDSRGVVAVRLTPAFRPSRRPSSRCRPQQADRQQARPDPSPRAACRGRAADAARDSSTARRCTGSGEVSATCTPAPGPLAGCARHSTAAATARGAVEHHRGAALRPRASSKPQVMASAGSPERGEQLVRVVARARRHRRRTSRSCVARSIHAAVSIASAPRGSSATGSVSVTTETSAAAATEVRAVGRAR